MLRTAPLRATRLLVVALASITAVALPVGSARSAAAATSGTAAATARPVVVLYGDSIAVQTAPALRERLGDAYDVQVRAFPGAALCDYLHQIDQDLQRYAPAMVLLDFGGNTFTPCTRVDGSIATAEQRLARYDADAQAVADRLAPLGIPLVLVGMPPEADAATAPAALQPLWDQVAARNRDLGRDVSSFDAGTAVAGPGGSWADRLPCLPDEGPAQGCEGGTIRVRADDGHHFCPARSNPFTGVCSTWSSGGRRYADAIARFVTDHLGGAPFGAMRATSPARAQVQVSGWAIDPLGGGSPIYVRAEVDGTPTAVGALAATPVPAVRATYRSEGASHGFDLSLDVARGHHTVCVTAFPVDGPPTAQLGCQELTVR